MSDQLFNTNYKKKLWWHFNEWGRDIDTGHHDDAVNGVFASGDCIFFCHDDDIGYIIKKYHNLRICLKKTETDYMYGGMYT